MTDVRTRKWGGPVGFAPRPRRLSEADQAVEAQVRQVIAEGPSGPGALIPLLQAIQGKLGYLPRASFRLLSERLGIPESRIFGVATFYAQFHLKPRGRYVVRVCQGTACHVRGGKSILEAVEAQLGIKPGDTTDDLFFTLERVACLGACGLAPTMIVNDDTFGRLTPAKARRILATLVKQPEAGAAGTG